MHHLEQMVPFAVTAIKNMSMQRDDGIITVFDMNTKNNLKFYAEDKYWNLDVKDEFMQETRGLWKGNFSSRKEGSLFTIREGMQSPEEKIANKITADELEAAIAKHGEVVLPSRYEDSWEQRLKDERAKVAATMEQ